MLELKDISIAYKDHQVLENVSLKAEAGEIIGLVAPNGTGKTTLFHIMANFLKPDNGEVYVGGRHTYRNEKDELYIHKQLAILPDQSDLFDELSGMDHLKLYGSMWKKETRHIQAIVDRLQMGSYVKKKVKTYSLGMRQRLCFAMMAAADTPIMLMDEVMNGLDIANVALISDYLIDMKRNMKLIFIASHLLKNLDVYADRVLFMKNKTIIHQQNMHERGEKFIKFEMSPDQYEKFMDRYDLPPNHLYIAGRLCCIPLDDMDTSEQITWISQLLSFEDIDFTVGAMGTTEYYERYYDE